MKGRIAVIAIVLSAVLVGGGIWYTQEYYYYDRIEPGSPASVIMMTSRLTGDQARENPGYRDFELDLLEFEGIDADSSPIRWRACFRINPGSHLPMHSAGMVYENPTPLVAPKWFDCFDAAQIGADLESGAAQAFYSPSDTPEDVDRVIAIYPDGRGYGWHQYEDKTPERGVMD